MACSCLTRCTTAEGQPWRKRPHQVLSCSLDCRQRVDCWGWRGRVCLLPLPLLRDWGLWVFWWPSSLPQAAPPPPLPEPGFKFRCSEWPPGGSGTARALVEFESTPGRPQQPGPCWAGWLDTHARTHTPFQTTGLPLPFVQRVHVAILSVHALPLMP